MTDELDQPLSEDQERRVTAALASARVTAPTPDDVVSRLRATLDTLVDERGTSAATEPGRRSNVPRWLLGAAASVVAVLALGLPALHSGPAEHPSAGRTGSRTPSATGAALPSLDRGTFRSDVRQLLGASRAHSAGVPRSPRATSSTEGLRTPACPLGTAPPGVSRRRVVLLDGHLAVLDVFAARRGSRLVRAVSCDGAETLASTRIPAG